MGEDGGDEEIAGKGPRGLAVDREVDRRAPPAAETVKERLRVRAKGRA